MSFTVWAKTKAFVDKINPFAEKIPEITDNINKLIEDEEFKKLLGNAGTVGALFNIGLYIFGKLSENIKDDEKSYYAIINKTALSVTQAIIKEKKLEIGEEKVTELIKNLLRIYKTENILVDSKILWNSFPYDHPIIIEFRRNVISLLNDNRLLRNYQNFAIDFNKRFSNVIDNNPKFKDYQTLQNFTKVSESRGKYFKWLIEELDNPSPIDGMKRTDYYVENKVVDLKRVPENWIIADDDEKIVSSPLESTFFLFLLP